MEQESLRATSDSDEFQIDAKRICTRKDDTPMITADPQSSLTTTDSLKAAISSSVPILSNGLYSENVPQTLLSSAPSNIRTETEMADKDNTNNRDETEQPTQDHQEEKHNDESHPATNQDHCFSQPMEDDPQPNKESSNRKCSETNQLTENHILHSSKENIHMQSEASTETRKIEITDSQLVWAAGSVGSPVPSGNGGIHDVTSLLRGLINELSSLNRLILDANKQMEVARRQRQDTLRKSKKRVHLGRHQLL
jgi:hypothetical protein